MKNEPRGPTPAPSSSHKAVECDLVGRNPREKHKAKCVGEKLKALDGNAVGFLPQTASPAFGMLLSASMPNRKSLAGRSRRYYGESEGITLTFGEGCRSLGNNTASRCPISLTRHKACSLAPSLPSFFGLGPRSGAVGKHYVSRSREVT
ncbi:hypothetical protein Baya_1136 [Bagarius yarrelli]|uniref:Uncharacterized protein n=1 Tax=Bagarius yarrelli TaxID=175774 RepID=A0A556TK86_BAGYA|nr:hypothetical protein Baya_1136 [Bagarius yarrelli]